KTLPLLLPVYTCHLFDSFFHSRLFFPVFLSRQARGISVFYAGGAIPRPHVRQFVCFRFHWFHPPSQDTKSAEKYPDLPLRAGDCKYYARLPAGLTPGNIPPVPLHLYRSIQCALPFLLFTLLLPQVQGDCGIGVFPFLQ